MDKMYQFAILTVCVILVLTIGSLALIQLYRRKAFLVKDNVIANLKSRIYEKDVEKERLEKMLLLSNSESSEDSQNEDVQGVVLLSEEQITFDEALEKLDGYSKKLYEEIIRYGRSLPETTVTRRKYYERLNFGKAKLIAKITIKKGNLVVATNIGNMRLHEGDVDPIKLSPIKTVVSDQESVEKVKNNIYGSYLRQSGQIKLTLEETNQETA